MIFLLAMPFHKAVLVIIVTTIVTIYLWFQYKFSYWSRKGVIAPLPEFPFGNIQNVIKRKAQFFQPYCDSYFKYKHLPYVGMYSFHRPVLCVIDPELARLIMIKDFDYFQSHGLFSGGVGDPLSGHLFNLHGREWRTLRTRMSPTFTTAKLKSLYPLVENIAQSALVYVDQLHLKGDTINFSEFYEKYVMEIIGSVGFGVECNGFNNHNSEFYLRGHEYFELSTYWNIVRAFAFIAPDLFNSLKIRRVSKGLVDFFYNLVQETVKYREKNSFRRNDFLQTLIDLKSSQEDDEDFRFSMKEVAANTMLYMFAGFETSATTGQFAAYEMASNPRVQQKARDEITTVLKKYNGECTYEAQNEMVYLNMVLDETMRKYPPARCLFRRCNKQYELPDGVVIEKGTLVFIPIQSIQMDPDIFPEPDKFDPERFSIENRPKHPCHWMPFGEGPRKCLGLRQGYVQSKMALVKLLQKYELGLDSRTSVPIKIKKTALSCAAEGGIWLKLRELHGRRNDEAAVSKV